MQAIWPRPVAKCPPNESGSRQSGRRRGSSTRLRSHRIPTSEGAVRSGGSDLVALVRSEPGSEETFRRRGRRPIEADYGNRKVATRSQGKRAASYLLLVCRPSIAFAEFVD